MKDQKLYVSFRHFQYRKTQRDRSESTGFQNGDFGDWGVTANGYVGVLWAMKMFCNPIVVKVAQILKHIKNYWIVHSKS